MVLRGESLGSNQLQMRSRRWSSHDGISSQMKRGRGTKPLFAMGAEGKGAAFCKSGTGFFNRNLFCRHLVLVFEDSKTLGNRYLLFKPTSSWYFVIDDELRHSQQVAHSCSVLLGFCLRNRTVVTMFQGWQGFSRWNTFLSTHCFND